MATRDFDDDTIAADWTAILSQAGITFSYLGASVTGVWSSSRDAFADFENQRRDESKFTVFLTTDQVSTTPAQTQTLVRNGITYFVEQVRFDAEGTGVEMDVCKQI